MKEFVRDSEENLERYMQEGKTEGNNLSSGDLILSDRAICGNNLKEDYVAYAESYWNAVKVILHSKSLREKNKKIMSLYHSCVRNDIDELKKLVRDGIDVNYKDGEGNTVAHYVLSQQKDSKRILKMLDMLTKVDENCINIQDNNGDTVLHYTVKFGYEGVVDFLVSKENLKVNSKNAQGCTALYFACLFGRKDMVEMLLKKENIDVNIKDNLGMTPLHCVVYVGKKDIVKLLLGHEKINVNEVDLAGRTPIRYACDKNDIDLVDMLLEKDGDLTIRDNWDFSTIEAVFSGENEETKNVVKRAIEKELEKICKMNDIEKLKNMLDICKKVHFSLRLPCNKESNLTGILLKNTEVMSANGKKTPLMLAIEHRDFSLAENLINNVDINACDIDGKNALMYVSSIKVVNSRDTQVYIDKTEYLIELLFLNKASVNAVDKMNRTALMYALMSRNISAANVLIKNGIDIFAKDINGKTTFMYALENRAYGVVRSFLDKKVYMYEGQYIDENERTLLMYAAKGAQRYVVQFMVGLFNVNFLNANKESALSWAIKGENRDAIECLLENGASIGLLSKEERRVLKKLTQHDEKIQVIIALQNSALNEILQYPENLINMALIYAIKYGMNDLAKCLINNNNIDMIHDCGEDRQESILTYAIGIRNEDMANYLIREGADVNGTSKVDVNGTSEYEIKPLMAISGGID